MSDDSDLTARRAAARAGCRSAVPGHGWVTPADRLAALGAADLGDPAAGSDLCGEGGLLAELEVEVAHLLGKPAAAFMPSGVMAQQCALRVWTDRAASPRIAAHALSHLVVHELSALERLHGLQVEHLGVDPWTPTVADLSAMPGRLGAVSLELPLRDAGHRLPAWDELEAFSSACREREVALHLDGARLWESTPYWGRELAEVAALADSVYVSFYKSLGALAGAALVGPQDVIDEARRWQRRHGGTLVTLLPYAVSARDGLREHLPRMPEYHATAVQVAAELSDRGLLPDPNPPHTNAFRVYAPRPVAEVNERLLGHLEEQRELLTPWFRAAEVPGWSRTEFAAGSATCAVGAAEAARRVAEVVLG